ncbi:ParA family protein [uncultured Albimonas sp.]|uniref:ParA family protein n=1 Tax=uncultured Albimonas sp. TaxID=1331701 RepID=UPI0030EE5557|tara:strand:+ start:3068 stop:3709 length:642 start_codon:yes stop_codon:yes gene_type:complete
MADTAGGTILVANLKGGCGKTVIATTLAAALARTGARVALADADRQKSALRWTRRRPVDAAPVEALDWSKSKDVGERPKKLDWLVIDAPGALRGGKAEELVAEARLLIAPLSPSFYDLDATRRFLKEIEELKRVRKGRVEVRLVGNRIRPRTRAAAGLDAEFEKLGHTPLARLSERAAYAELAEQGLSIFDRPAKALEPMRAQWAPILDALKE